MVVVVCSSLGLGLGLGTKIGVTAFGVCLWNNDLVLGVAFWIWFCGCWVKVACLDFVGHGAPWVASVVVYRRRFVVPFMSCFFFPFVVGHVPVVTHTTPLLWMLLSLRLATCRPCPSSFLTGVPRLLQTRALAT
jgi:hypothetical protein